MSSQVFDIAFSVCNVNVVIVASAYCESDYKSSRCLNTFMR